MSQWFLIDQHGQRPVHSPVDLGSKDMDAQWPDFCQLVLDARLDHIRLAIQTWARTLDLQAEDVTETPHHWEDALLITRNGPSYCIFQTPYDPDETLLHTDSCEMIAGLLSCNAALFGAQTHSGLIFLNTFELGQIDLAWYDSELPELSFARVFHRQGSCTEEDPRLYALTRMDMPATSPLLDRFAFIETLLKPFELHEVTPIPPLDEVVCAIKLTHIP